jgi:adenylate kinase
VVQEEAMESYRPEIVWILKSETVEDMEENIEKLKAWVNSKRSA